MATVVTTCSYSKGRGRGVLALKENFLQKKPGGAQSNVSTTTATKLEAPGPEVPGPEVPGPEAPGPEVPGPEAPGPEAPGPEAPGPEAGEGDSAAKSKKVLIVMHKYTANANSPGGFPELSVEKGQLVELCGAHPDNEHWWEVRNEDGETGFIPSSYVIIKEECLPWLQLSSLKSEEDERKERVKRLTSQKSVSEGKGGFGPAPKPQGGVVINSKDRYYCKLCDKRLNGPKPYSAHMASRAHKEEVALRELYP